MEGARPVVSLSACAGSDGLEQVAAFFAGVDLDDPAAKQALGRKIAELQRPLDGAAANV